MTTFTYDPASPQAKIIRRIYVIDQLLEVWPNMSDETKACLLEERSRAYEALKSS